MLYRKVVLILLNLNLLRIHVKHIEETTECIKKKYEEIEKILREENKDTVDELIDFYGKDEAYFDKILEIYSMSEFQKYNVDNILEYIDKNI